MQIYQPLVFRRAITEGNLGLGEAYMDGWWECDDLEEFFFRLLSSKADEKIVTPVNLIEKWIGKTVNLQNPLRAFTVGETHYNIGNDLFEAMLDKRMINSCGYWKETSSLDEAQEKKLRLVFDKLQLQPGTNGDPWSCKYIFPNSMLPAASQITKNYEGLFTLEDWHVFTHDYSLTLRAWHENFEKQWPKLQSRYGEKFHRMWCYYLLSFSGSFRARSIQLWQVLLSKNGLPGRTSIPR
jgi:cyclopropane fatty-acyl-phospholipid synthase-like methyltransferase